MTALAYTAVLTRPHLLALVSIIDKVLITKLYCHFNSLVRDILAAGGTKVIETEGITEAVAVTGVIGVVIRNCDYRSNRAVGGTVAIIAFK